MMTLQAPFLHRAWWAFGIHGVAPACHGLAKGLGSQLAALTLLVWLGGPVAQAAGESNPIHSVLLLYSDERMLPAGIIVDRVLRETLEDELGGAVDIHSEYLDQTRFPGDDFAEKQSQFLQEKYAGRMPDLVVAGGTAALNFLLEFRESLFSGVPVVHCAVAEQHLPPSMPDEAIVGIPLTLLYAGSLDLAIHLQPGIRKVAVVAGTSERDRSFVDAFRKTASRFESNIRFSWLTNLSIEDLSEEVSRLPEDSVVLYLGIFRDAKGRTFVPQRALAIFAPSSAVPIYGSYDTYLGYGVVGGMMVTFEEIGRETARIAVRILEGIDPQDAVDFETFRSRPMFDWKEVERWGLENSRFPPDSIFLNREPTFWKTHGNVILLIGAVCLIEAGLIALLIFQIRRRRKAENSIRESEQRMNLAIESANFGIWIHEVVKGEVWATAKWREIFGFSPTEGLSFEKVIDRISESDRADVLRTIAEAEPRCGAYEITFRIQDPGGEVRWISARGRFIGDAQGCAIRAMGVSRDVTEQKRAEATTQDLSGRLIHAQEEAQGRLARELHDDLSQRLALLAVNLEMFEQNHGASKPDLSSGMQAFALQVKTIASDIHRLAHHLHPAKLDQLGLEPALHSFCREFSQAHQLAIHFHASKVPRSIPDAIALCLYRITQEALHNVVKHSGATEAEVHLEWSAGELNLVVADNGIGIDIKSPKTSSSLGVIAMEERARFVHGRFSISRRGEGGTKVEIRIPLIGVASSPVAALPPIPDPNPSPV